MTLWNRLSTIIPSSNARAKALTSATGVLALASAFAWSSAAWAGSDMGTMPAAVSAVPASASQTGTNQADAAAGKDAMVMTEGEVRKVDMDTKKVTLKHAEIKNLGMPSMTMVFQVPDATALGALKPGDKVRFMAERQGGALVVTHIEAAK